MGLTVGMYGKIVIHLFSDILMSGTNGYEKYNEKSQ